MESEPRASATATTKRRRVQKRHKQISRSLSPRLPCTPVRCCRCHDLPANPKTEFDFQHSHTDGFLLIHIIQSTFTLRRVLILIFPLSGFLLPKSQSVFPGPFFSIHLVLTFIHLFFIPYNLTTSHQPHFHPSGLDYRLFSFSFSFSSKTFTFFLSFSFHEKDQISFVILI